MRPPFTLVSGYRQSQSPNIVRSRKAKDENNKEATAASSTPSRKLQSISHTAAATASPQRHQRPASPSVFTRSPIVQEADAFSSTAYILDDMMDIDEDTPDDLLSAPAETVDMRADDIFPNNNIFASPSRVSTTPQSSRKALQVKTKGDHVEFRIVEQHKDIRPEHVPLPPSSPLKQQQSPVKRVITSTVEEEDGGDARMDVGEPANIFQRDVTEQAAAIPLPPSPGKPRTGSQAVPSISESPSEHGAREQGAESADNDIDMLDSSQHVSVNNELRPPSSPHKDQEIESAIQAEALLSPTQEHVAAFSHQLLQNDEDTAAAQDGDTTLEMARNVGLPLSPEKLPRVQSEQDEEEASVHANGNANEDVAESSTGTTNQALLASHKQSVEDMLDLLQESDNPDNEDGEDDDIEKEYKAAERACYKAGLDIRKDGHDDEVDDSEEDDSEIEMKEEIFKVLQDAREGIAEHADEDDGTIPALEPEEEEKEIANVRQACHQTISKLSATLSKKKEDREVFTEQMKEILDETERIVRQEEQEEQDEVRGLNSPVVHHVEAFPPTRNEKKTEEERTESPSKPAVSARQEFREDQDQEEEEDATLQLAINTELPPSPEKKSSLVLEQQEEQEEDEDPLQQDPQSTLLQEKAEGSSSSEPQSQTCLDRHESAAVSIGALQTMAGRPEEPTSALPAAQLENTSTPSRSFHASSSGQANANADTNATPSPVHKHEQHDETHLKAPTATRQLNKNTKPKSTATRARGRPKGSVKNKDLIVDDAPSAGSASFEEVSAGGEAGAQQEEMPARRSTRSKSTLSRSASKESLASAASTSTSTGGTGKRGASKRKRSASVVSAQADKEKLVTAVDPRGVKTEDTTMQLDQEPAFHAISGQDCAPGGMEETSPEGESAAITQAAPSTAKRTSRRIDAVSALPQPKYKLKRQHTATAETSSTTASSSSSSAMSSALEESGNKRRKTAKSADTSSDQLVASASCASTTPREAVLPVKRAIPQRSTRTPATLGKAAAGSAKADSKAATSVMRSPSRVVGSPKRGNTLGARNQGKEAQQQQKKTIPLFAQPNSHRVKDDHVPSPGPRTAPRSPSRVIQAQNATSPTKSAAASSSSVNVAVMRSPLRIPGAGGNFDWPKSTTSTAHKAEIGASKPVTGYSEETWMRARSKVFGDKIPAKHAGGPSTSINTLKSSTNGLKSSSSSSAAHATVSPIKTAVSQRMLAPPSPGLLNLSVTPESLLLVSASPALAPPPSVVDSAGQSSSFLTTSADPPNVAAASSVFSSQRGVSQPPLGLSQGIAKGSTALSSPRRALSAQPPPSPRRVDLPSPRRVIASSSSAPKPMPSPARIAAVFSAPPAGMGSSATTSVAGRLPSLPPKQSTASDEAVQTGDGETTEIQTPVVTPKTQSTAIPTGRRSARTTKQREKFPDLAAASTSTTKSTTSTRTMPARALPPVKSAPGMTAAQLAALTMKNTNSNKAHYNVHKVTTIYKNEDRPPSPTSKIRKIMEEPDVVASSTSSTSATQNNKALRIGAKRKAEEAGLALLEGKGKGKQVDNVSITTASGRKPHFKAAGDQDIFESPVKLQKVNNDDKRDQPNRAVKWDRDLLKEVQDIRTPRRAKSKASEALSRKAFKVNHELDLNGNVPNCKASISPMVPRQQVSISKIIYRDDPDE